MYRTLHWFFSLLMSRGTFRNKQIILKKKLVEIKKLTFLMKYFYVLVFLFITPQNKYIDILDACDRLKMKLPLVNLTCTWTSSPTTIYNFPHFAISHEIFGTLAQSINTLHYFIYLLFFLLFFILLFLTLSHSFNSSCLFFFIVIFCTSSMLSSWRD